MSMSTPAAAVDLGEDRWVALPASWRTYLRLLADRGDRPRPRYIFLDGRLTAVSPGVPHELLRARLGGLLEDMLGILQIPFRPTGSVTLLKSRRSREGVEPDASYYLTNLGSLRGKRRLVMGEDPPPDLAVEVVVSHPEGDAIEAYRRFGVREVWVVRASGLAFLVPGDGPACAPSPTSRLLPFLAPDDLSSWLFRDDVEDEGALRREFRAWVERELAPRLPGARD